MPRRDHSTVRFTQHLAFAVTAAFLVILWIAGGASRADVLGQVVTRFAAWAIAIAYILFAGRPQSRAVAPIAVFVFAATALAALQLIPLPPAIWTQLPGRDLLAQAALVSGQEQPWRPLSISPGATINALSSLIVPIVALLLVAKLSAKEQWRLVTFLLGLIVASSLVGLLQFSGARFDHPLINDVSGSVSGFFANRNHFALFVAMGCLMAPVWGFQEGHTARWRGPAAMSLLLLFALIILASGSRAGMLLGALAIGLGLLSVRRRIGSELRRLPKKAAIALVVASTALLVAAIVLSVTLDRAVSVDRALLLDAGEDARRQILPTVLAMTELYFPFGSGIGTFDPVFRIYEPTALLITSYYNHAHNDLLEVVLDAGLPGLLLLGAAIVWWGWKSIGAWRAKKGPQSLLPRLGSGILLLVLIASLTDYPARTPMIMAMIVIAAVWLNGSMQQDAKRGRSAQRTDRALDKAGPMQASA